MTMTAQRPPDAPREDLIRMSTSIRAAEDGNTLVGYAAVFNEPTTIDSWEGQFIEQIAPGAFRKTLKERGDQIKVLFNHGMDPSIGDKPLGKPSVQKEDSYGLAVECPLDDTSYNLDIKALLRSGALDGMSFRMSVVNDKWTYPADGENGLPVRTITEIRLYEWGPVTFPAYAATQAGVRSHAPVAFEAWRSATGTPKTVVPSPDQPGEDHTDDSTDEPDTDPPAGDTATEATDVPGATSQDNDTAAPATRTADEPPGTEHSSSQRRRPKAHSTRYQRELTLAYVEEMLGHSKRRSQEHESSVRQFERLTGKV